MFEPHDQTKLYGFWRLYYTAFSRAQDLLIITCPEDARIPSAFFRNTYNALPAWNSGAFNINEFSFHDIKNVNLKYNSHLF